MRPYIKMIPVGLAIFMISVNCHGEGLSSLAEVGKEQEQMERELKTETKTYEKIKKALSRESITIGQSQEAILKSYGEPVIIVPEQGEYSERWVYKPGNATYFENQKIYLYFDNNKTLAAIKDSEPE